MPVIILERDYEGWLKAEPDRPPIDLLRPYDADKGDSVEVDKQSANVNNGSPELLSRLQPRPDRRRIASQKLHA